MIYNSITELIGNTPMLRLLNFQNNNDINANIYAKLEYFNPAGSVKDRVAFNMIKDAKDKGLIKDNTVIIEPTSGNTGIGLAMAARAMGLKIIIVMPDTMSVERRKLMTAYGAELVLTDGKLGMSGAIEKAKQLSEEYDDSFIPNQFENEANANAHYLSTGKEIYNDLPDVDIFVACVGTGGTISGVGRYLKEKNANIKIVAVEPSSSAVLSGEKAGAHKIQGIGAGFIPKILERKVIDEVITVSDEDAYSFGRNLAKDEGFLVGISSGAALCAALTLAKRPENVGKNIVVLLPDTGDRYLSTENYFS